MSAPPYMKLYVADYLGDTHHLSAIEHGAYLLLLMGMWRAGGKLPAQDLNLAKIARCTPDEWAAIKPVVLAFFKVSRGRLAHKRLAEEMAKYENTSGKRSEASQKAVRKKGPRNSGLVSAIDDQEFSNSRHNQNQNQIVPNGPISSEPKGSAQLSLLDPDQLAWTQAIAVQTEAGVSDKSARSFFGRLLSENGLKAADLLTAVSSAISSRTGDPQAYLRQAARGVARRQQGTSQATVADAGFC